MDIRQVNESKPNLGQVVEARFRIIHNLRTIRQHEARTASFLSANGPQKVSTRRRCFLLSTRDGKSVDVVISEPRPDGQPFLSFPEPVRLFCVEIGILNENSQVFNDKTEDEVMQILTELLELAPQGELLVEKGKFIVCIRLRENKIHFLAPELSRMHDGGIVSNGKPETQTQLSHE